MDERKATLAMKCVIDQGGLAPGGLNFDCKVRRESTDIEDMFISHIAGMDCFAKGLRNAARLIEQGTLDSMVAERYKSWNSGLGAKVEAGNASIDEMYEYALSNGEPKMISAQQELYERVFNHGCDDRTD
jgi:xylose isomerase